MLNYQLKLKEVERFYKKESSFLKKLNYLIRFKNMS